MAAQCSVDGLDPCNGSVKLRTFGEQKVSACDRHYERFRQPWGCGKSVAKWNEWKRTKSAERDAGGGGRGGGGGGGGGGRGGREDRRQDDRRDDERPDGVGSSELGSSPIAEDIGRRLKVHWASSSTWFEGVLDAIEAGHDDGNDTGDYHVVYDDGDELWEPLGSRTRYKWLGERRVQRGADESHGRGGGGAGDVLPQLQSMAEALARDKVCTFPSTSTPTTAATAAATTTTTTTTIAR